MKRNIILMVMVVLVAASMSAAASEYFDAEKMDLVGGITYNTFDLTKTVDGSTVEDANDYDDSLANGIGFFVGGRYWVKEDIAVGLGWDKAGSNFTDNNDVKTAFSISGPYAEVVYNLNENFNLNAAVASYSIAKNETVGDTKDELLKGNGLGFVLGGEYNYNLNEDFDFNGSLGYRIADLNVSEDNGAEVDDTTFNMSGLRAAFGVNYHF